MPEFFGDVAVINSVVQPFVKVEPRRYRLRIVNGSQARFYNLKFASVGGNFRLPFWQIGADGGLLRAPVQTTTLLIAPGERADVIVDFSGQKKTTQWVLKNDAKAPFPMGGGGDVSQLMLFNVNLPLNGTDTTTPPASLALPTLPTLLGPPADVTREQHLQEILDPATGIPMFLQLENARYLDEATGLPSVATKPQEHAVEDWLLVNTTADTHPIHLHLVHFEVADRRPFDPGEYLDAIAEGEPPEITYTGPAVPANPNENGLKDTVHANPGEVTRIRAKYDLPAGAVKPAQYVWHCHILEHEENDMMRAFEVV